MTVHADLVAKIVRERGAIVKGQKRRILDAVFGRCTCGRHEVCACKDTECMSNHEAKCFRCTMGSGMDVHGRAVPDAVHIDHEAEVVTIYEVEVTSTLDERKMAVYGDWAWILDEEHWTLKIVVVSRLGVETELDPLVRSYDPAVGHRVAELLARVA